jgi:hypothetical protein
MPEDPPTIIVTFVAANLASIAMLFSQSGVKTQRSGPSSP